MSEDFNRNAREAVANSPEYQSLDPEAKKAINGLMGLLEMGMVPPIEMATTVMMTAIGVVLRDHEGFQKLTDNGIYHVKGTNSLAIVAGGWVLRLDASMFDEDDVDMNDLEPM